MTIVLRTPTWQDMGYIRWLWGDEETMQPVGGPVYLTEKQALEWYQRMIDPGGMTERYMLISNENQHLMGEVSFHRFEPKTGTAMFNLKIAGSERGKGYARAGMRSFLHAFFNGIGGRIMLDDIALDNLRGQEVLVRFGFMHDPSMKDVVRMDITKVCFNDLYGLVSESIPVFPTRVR